MSTKKTPITEAQQDRADLQIRALQKEISYDLRDFTVEFIVKKFEKGEFFIPDYQRKYVWPDRNKNRFVESLLLGLPIPFMFVVDNPEGLLEIVDGAQRIQSLEQFVNNDLRLAGLEKLTEVNGFTFDDLPLFQRRKFLNRSLRLIVLEESTKIEVRQELFDRVNTGSMKAKGSELRRGAFQGNFMDAVKELSELPQFVRLCPISIRGEQHRESEELLLRFFAYSDRYESFKHDVEKFLNDYVKDNRDGPDLPRQRVELTRTLDFVDKFFPYGFAKHKGAKSTPRVRFEAIAIGVNLALRQNSSLQVSKSLVNEWLESPEFQALTTTHASNSGPRLRGRVEFVMKKLLGAAI